MEILRIDHVSLDVRDRPASLSWYAEVLGLPARNAHSVPDAPVFLGPDGAQFGLFAELPAGLRHIALATTPADQARLRARLERLGIPYRPERHGPNDSLYFADPDGAVIEVLAPRA